MSLEIQQQIEIDEIQSVGERYSQAVLTMDTNNNISIGGNQNCDIELFEVRSMKQLALVKFDEAQEAWLVSSLPNVHENDKVGVLGLSTKSSYPVPTWSYRFLNNGDVITFDARNGVTEKLIFQESEDKKRARLIALPPNSRGLLARIEEGLKDGCFAELMSEIVNRYTEELPGRVNQANDLATQKPYADPIEGHDWYSQPTQPVRTAEINQAFRSISLKEMGRSAMNALIARLKKTS